MSRCACRPSPRRRSGGNRGTARAGRAPTATRHRSGPSRHRRTAGHRPRAPAPPRPARVPRPERLVPLEVEEHRPGAGGGAEHGRGVLGGVVAVGDHRAVAVDRHRDGDRRVPAGVAARHRQVDPLLFLQHPPAELAVVVVAERGPERGAQAEPGTGDGEVRDAAGARAHPVGPHLGARPGQLRSPVKTMSRKTMPCTNTSNCGSPASRTAASGSNVWGGTSPSWTDRGRPQATCANCD